MAIQLDLTLEEVNGVLQALGQLPFVQVAGLVEKVRTQATPQVEALQAQEAANTEAPAA